MKHIPVVSVPSTERVGRSSIRLLAGSPTRRAALGLVGGGLALSCIPPAFAQRRAAQGPAEVSVEELMKPNPLGEVIVGRADAPVTIVEYASLTCSHCATFHIKVFPVLKEKYVDTGKVRFMLREFPLDNLAAAASMLTRCVDADKTYPMITVLFSKQDEWAFVKAPVPELFRFAKQAGFTQETFDKCLTDQKKLDEVIGVRERAAEKFAVTATPSFFINGKRHTGAPTVEDFEKALAPLLKS